MKAPSSPGSFEQVLAAERAARRELTKDAIAQVVRNRMVRARRNYTNGGPEQRPDEWPLETVDPGQCLYCGRLLVVHKLTERCY